MRNSNRTGTVASVSVGSLARSAPSVSTSSSNFNGYNISCNGGSDGSITVSSLTGGQGAPYQLKLNAGGTYQTTTTSRLYSSLAAGAYTIYIQDSVGCVSTTSVTLTQPTVVTSTISASSLPTCVDSSNGSVTATAGGGVGSYTYSINGGSSYQSSNAFTGLTNGTYSIISKDANGCATTSSSTTLNRTAVSATFTQTNVSCNGGSDGSIAVSSGTGGSGTGYSASTNNSTYYTLPKTFGSLTAAGSPYYIYVKDSNGCVNSFDFTITQPTAGFASAAVTHTDDGTGIGEIGVSVSGGTGTKTVRLYLDTTTPYNDHTKSVLIASGTSVANSTTYYFGSLTCSSGRHWAEVTDANGCVVTTNSVQLCGYYYIGKYTSSNTIQCTPTGNLVNVYLSYTDYVAFIANSGPGGVLGLLQPGMTLYADQNGNTLSTTRVYDPGTTNIWGLSSGVVSANPYQYC